MSTRIGLATLVLGVVASVASAGIINDGTTTADLTMVATAAPAGTTHDVQLTVDGSGQFLNAYTEEIPLTDDSSAKGIWYSNTTAVDTDTYTTSADFKPYSDNGRYRGGVVGWFDDSTNEGIGLYVKYGSSFRVRTMKFNEVGDADNEDSGDYLYKTDGSKKGGSGFDFDMSGYDVNDWATFELAFSDADPLDGFTDVVATVTQGTNVWTQAFKINMPQPADVNHRVGYLGYQGSSPGGDVGSLDNLTYVPEPATLTLLAVGGLAAIRRRR